MMSDTERLNLIEYYEWIIICRTGKWTILGKFHGMAHGNTLREAFNDAYDKQAKWALER